MQLAKTGLKQNKPPPPAPFRVGAEGAEEAGFATSGGSNPGAGRVYTGGCGGARCWWVRWWVLVGGAVVGLGEVGSGGVVERCDCGCRCCWV